MSATLSAKISYINTRLTDDIKAKASIDWLKECIAYFLKEDSLMHNDHLYTSVLEQFTLANMSNTSNRVIPDTFQTKKDPWTLKDSLLLQMQFIVDISEPFYDQWRNLHNQRLDEVIEDKRESKTFHSKKKRMFKLELTDGYKNIQAMEIKQISSLNTKLTPGIKILFTGPIQVVNHIMMIKPENVRIVGGEVDELMVINAYENVLLRHLNRPTTDNPITNYEEPTVENEKSSTAKPQNIVRMQEPKCEPPRQQNNVNNFMDDDEDIDLAMIEAIERQELKKSQETDTAANLPQNTDMDIDIDDYILAQIDLEEEMLRDGRSTISSDDRKNRKSFEDNSVRKRKSTDSPVKNVPITKVMKLSPVRKPTITDNDYPFKIDGRYNFVTLDQYAGMPKSDKMAREYTIEASVDRVCRIKATENGWLLLVDIRDAYSSSTLSVRFADEIVAEFGKRSAKEVLLLRQKMLGGQPQLKMDIESTLALINQTLKNGPFLMCIKMNVTLPANYEHIVTRLLTRSGTTKQTIASKIKAENISLS